MLRAEFRSQNRGRKPKEQIGKWPIVQKKKNTKQCGLRKSRKALNNKAALPRTYVIMQLV